MITTCQKPRKRPAPSERNQQIYLDYQALGRSQSELAADYHLSQTRISQILRHVEAWLASVGWDQLAPASADPPSSTLNLEPGTLHSVAAALEQRLERERLNFVCREALRCFRQEQKTTTHKKGTRGDKSFDETTVRIAPPNVQCLKTILQANHQLNQSSRHWAPTQSVGRRDVPESAAFGHGSRPAKPDDAGPPSSVGDREPGTSDSYIAKRNECGLLLADLISQAVANHKVESVGHEAAFAFDLLNFLLGTHHSGFALDSIFARTGHAAREADAPAEPPGGCMESAPADETHRTTSSQTTSSTTCAPNSDSPQPQSPPDFPIPNPKLKIESGPPPNPEFSRDAINAAFRRRMEHYKKLDQLRAAQASGVPYSFAFNASDGPLPRDECLVADPGWQPTRPTKDEQAQLVRDYMQKLHEQNSAKNHCPNLAMPS